MRQNFFVEQLWIHGIILRFYTILPYKVVGELHAVVEQLITHDPAYIYS